MMQSFTNSKCKMLRRELMRLLSTQTGTRFSNKIFEATKETLTSTLTLKNLQGTCRKSNLKLQLGLQNTVSGQVKLGLDLQPTLDGFISQQTLYHFTMFSLDFKIASTLLNSTSLVMTGRMQITGCTSRKTQMSSSTCLAR